MSTRLVWWHGWRCWLQSCLGPCSDAQVMLSVTSRTVVTGPGTLSVPSEHRDGPASGAEGLVNCSQAPTQ